MSEIAARHAHALLVSREAGAMALDWWRRRAELTVESKANLQDIVSEADRAVERLVRERVAAAFPDDGFLGEEYGLTPGASGFTWVVDPIDGTSPYLHGIPNWCVSVAVVRGDETVSGVIEAPTHGETFSAVLGGGAFVNGARVALPGDLGLRNAATAVGASHKTDPAWVAKVTGDVTAAGGVFFRNGSGALMLAYVGAGRLCGYLEAYMNSWDCLAGLLMVRDAGGLTNAFPESGDLTVGGRVIAAAPGAWDELAAIVGA